MLFLCILTLLNVVTGKTNMKKGRCFELLTKALASTSTESTNNTAVENTERILLYPLNFAQV